MNRKIFQEAIKINLLPIILTNGYTLTSNMYNNEDLLFKKEDNGWYFFIEFQYDNRYEKTKEGCFYINLYRLTVDSPYYTSIYDNNGKYIPNTLYIRVPGGLKLFRPNHHLIQSLSLPLLMGGRWKYTSIEELYAILIIIRPLLIIHIEIMNDLSLSINQEDQI